MIIAIDIGGTKTLVASVNENGQVKDKIKFPTPKDYDEFIRELISQIKTIAGTEDEISVISIAVPGKVDRAHGIIERLGNLPWINKAIISDIGRSLPANRVIFENDANLAALSEANELENIDQRVLYVTFSTGVGTGFVINGRLDESLLDCEGGHMVFEHDGRLMDWESFAAGKAIVEKYGKMASELEDPEAWREIAKNMAIGIVDNNAVFQADTVIIGGGVGTHFEKYGEMLREEAGKILAETEMVKKPVIVGAQHAEEAVLLGCIVYANQHE